MSAPAGAETSIARLLGGSHLPPHEAVRLLSIVSGLSRASIATTDTVDTTVAARFAALADRRRAGVPLQHLEGTVAFGPLELKCDGRALVPRPETEGLWEEAVARLGDAGPGTVIVDLCTGSGNLALALKHAFPAARVFATDLSSAALTLASENAAATGLEVTFLEGDLFSPLPVELRGRVDLIVANPPYVAEADFAALPAEVREHDPREALVAGPDGDEVISRIADEAYWWLGVGGWLLCEIGADQGPRALDLFASLGAIVLPDAAGRDRVVLGRKGAPCCR